jgi:hypothetical protein
MYRLQRKEIMMATANEVGTNWRLWGRWGLAFLGFPLGGLAALGVVGGVETSLDALLGGLATGAVIGAAQWLAARPRLGDAYAWVAATAFGMGAGLALAVGLLGSDTSGSELLWRGALTGLAIGIAQWLVLRRHYANAIVWVPTIAIGWALGWLVTRAVGVDLSPNFSVFGSTGAWAFQLLSGLVLGWLLRQQNLKA